MIDVFLLLLDELVGSTPFYIPVLAAVLFGIGLYLLHRKYQLPSYLRKAAVLSASAVFVFLTACICMDLVRSAGDAFPASGGDVRAVGLLLLALAVASVLALLIAVSRALSVYLGDWRKLRETIRCTRTESFDYSPTAAWRVLQSLQPSRLTWRQRERYGKYRTYIRMLLGNFSGVAEELEQLREKDKAYYHFLKYVQCTAMGHMEDAAREIRQAEEHADGDTEPLIRAQIILDRGTGYVGIGLYDAADDAFCRAIAYCKKHRIKEKMVWELLYYNYVFNQLRLHPKLTRQQWEALLEPLREHLDMESPRDYMTFSNIELELLRQTNADREEIDEELCRSFDFFMRSDIPADNRCVLEASFARMVWSARGNPTDVLRMLERDRKRLLDLPMPARYNCFHQIDIFFADLHGGIVEQYDLLKQSAFWYMKNQARQDLEEYRRSLPAEAVYDRCFCLTELAGQHQKDPKAYRWETAVEWLETAMALYRENGLELEEMNCRLALMDEATSPLNMDCNFELTRSEQMKAMLERIEEAIPKFEKHPVMAEIALRLSFYCCVMHDYERCKRYYETYAHLSGIVALGHFAPCLHRYYMLVCFTVRTLYFLDAVHAVREELKGQEEPTLADEWFLHFYDRNGAYESIVLAMVLGIEDGMMLKTKLWPLAEGEDFCRTAEGIAEHLWLLLPQLKMEIDVTYAQFAQDADCGRIVFNQNFHPMERNQSNYLKKRRVEHLPLFAETYVQVIQIGQLAQKQQEALREVYGRIIERLPEECPSVAQLSELYRTTMLPVGL